MKICVGLSGGVDSSVAALLLKRQGYDVFALFMQNWHDTAGTLHGDCEWEEDRTVAEMVARKIGIPFHFVDLSDVYRQRVVDYMFGEYEAGRTPNPDVMCNREIKFDAFLKEAQRLGADFVATGHYCRKDETVGSDGKTVYRIYEGTDPNKDQSYFLCQLNQQQLSKALFPIGHLLKPEVRRIAAEAGLPSAGKKDSQGICFVGKVDLPVFLQQKLKSVEGDIVEVYPAYYRTNSLYNCQQAILDRIDSADAPSLRPDTIFAAGLGYGEMPASNIVSGRQADGSCDTVAAALADSELATLAARQTYDDLVFETETYRSGRKHVKKTRYRENPFGKIVGRHEGAQFYTIGQRRGLAVGGHAESVFVIHTDIGKNVIYVGEGHTHPGLLQRCLRVDAKDIHWIRPDISLPVGGQLRQRVRIRYRQPLEDAVLLMREDGLYILFDRDQRGITPGQFAVWYDASGQMLGSGVIA